MRPVRQLGKNREENEWYGFVDNDIIAVNIQLLWEEDQDEDKFIRRFAKTYTHELLHQVIDSLLYELREMKEEEIIRKSLKERWNKRIRKMYE